MAAPSRQEVPLLAAKLSPPPLPPRHRERPRVNALLDAALDEAIRLTLLSAPAGYGKSVAVAGWLASRRPPFAWLTLDASDDDPARFVRYLVAALRAVRPAAGEGSLGLVATGATPSVELLGATLVGEVAAAEEPFVLVLDDYAAIGAEPVHELVRFLVRNAPPFARIVVATRRDPPLPLARLRAHGRLVELRAAELRYSAEEAAAFLAAATDQTVAAEAAGRVAERTEGWAAALQLAALAMRRGGAEASGPPGRLEPLDRSRPAIFEYLADEVLAGLDPEMRGFLVRTSIPERFTAELAAELSGRPDAPALLARAEAANLLVAPVSADGEWHRYHPLFAEYLRTLVPPGEVAALHDCVAAYLERSGLRAEAIEHALAARSLDRAARLIELEARPAFESGQLVGLLRWLDALPPARASASADLVALRGWALVLTGQLPEVFGLVASATRDDGSGAEGPAQGRLLALRSMMSTITQEDAGPLARRAVDLLGDDHFFRAIALLALGMDLWPRGETAAALEAWRSGFDVAALSGQPMVVALAATALASGLHDVGARAEAETLCRRVLAEHVTASGEPQPMAWFVRMPLGLLRYEANDLDEARLELERGFEGAGVFGFGRVLASFALGYLALAREATGAHAAALELARSGARAARQAGIPPFGEEEIEARIALLQGDLDAAGRWADEAATARSPLLVGGLLVAQRATVARVRIAQRRQADALATLARARDDARRLGLVAELISLRVLEAVADDALGDRTAALRALGEAVRLAAPGGFVRRFVDDGAALGPLLPLVRRDAPEFVDELVAALRPAAPASGRGAGGRLWRTASGELLEALTGREREVLALIARGATNADIATALAMSPGTARWHVANVLAKLGARSRTHALVRARELGLV